MQRKGYQTMNKGKDNGENTELLETFKAGIAHSLALVEQMSVTDRQRALLALQGLVEVTNSPEPSSTKPKPKKSTTRTRHEDPLKSDDEDEECPPSFKTMLTREKGKLPENMLSTQDKKDNASNQKRHPGFQQANKPTTDKRKTRGGPVTQRLEVQKEMLRRNVKQTKGNRKTQANNSSQKKTKKAKMISTGKKKPAVKQSSTQQKDPKTKIGNTETLIETEEIGSITILQADHDYVGSYGNTFQAGADGENQLRERKASSNRRGSLHSCTHCNGNFCSAIGIRDHLRRQKRTTLKPMRCKCCNQTFSSYCVLILHQVKAKHSLKPYKCKHCEKAYFAAEKLKNHEAKYHEREFEKVPCVLCRRLFTSARSLKAHIYSHTRDLPDKCRLCKTKIHTKVDLENHQKSHQNSGGNLYISGLVRIVQEAKRSSYKKRRSGKNQLTFPCDYCPKDFSMKSNLRRHVIQVHQGIKPYNCIKCSKGFFKTIHYRKHLKEQHGDGNGCDLETVTCKICQKVFSSASNLRVHMNVHAKEAPFQCKLCGRRFSFNNNLKRHMYTHQETKPFLCDKCDKSFTDKRLLAKHITVHHEGIKNTELIFFCEVCNKGFCTRSSLYTHKVVHSEVKKYTCTECDKKFSLKSNLTRHERIHRGEKPFQCEICQKTFTERRSVLVHQRLHTGEKPFECDICGKKFTQSGALNTHMACHTRNRDFECNQCGKTFKRKSHFNLHMKKHNSSPTHMCPECGLAFYRRGDMMKHAETHLPKKSHTCQYCHQVFTRADYLKNHLSSGQCGLKPQLKNLPKDSEKEIKIIEIQPDFGDTRYILFSNPSPAGGNQSMLSIPNTNSPALMRVTDDGLEEVSTIISTPKGSSLLRIGNSTTAEKNIVINADVCKPGEEFQLISGPTMTASLDTPDGTTSNDALETRTALCASDLMAQNAVKTTIDPNQVQLTLQSSGVEDQQGNSVITVGGENAPQGQVLNVSHLNLSDLTYIYQDAVIQGEGDQNIVYAPITEDGKTKWPLLETAKNPEDGTTQIIYITQPE